MAELSSPACSLLRSVAETMECDDGFLPYEQEILVAGLQAAAELLCDSGAGEAGDWLAQIANELMCINVLPQANFNALQNRLDRPGQYDARVAKVLSAPAPWEDDCDKTSTPADQ